MLRHRAAHLQEARRESAHGTSHSPNLRSKSDAKKFHLPFCLYSHLMREEVDNLSNKLANSLLTLKLSKDHQGLSV